MTDPSSHVFRDREGWWWLSQSHVLVRMQRAALLIAGALLAIGMGTALQLVHPLGATLVALVTVVTGLALGLQWARTGTGRVGASSAGLLAQEGLRVLQVRWDDIREVELYTAGRRTRIALVTTGERFVTRTRFRRASASTWLERAAAAAEADGRTVVVNPTSFQLAHP